jgi:hypothetical protein
MPSTTQLVQSIRQKDFLEAKEQFASLIQDKMRTALAREYQDAAKTIGVREATDPMTTRTTVTEDLSWSKFMEFFVYYNGTQTVNDLIGIIIGLGVLIAVRTPEWISTIAKKYSAWIRESERTYQIYQMKKSLSPEDIQRSVTAAKSIYPLFNPQLKAKLTTISKQLSTADLSSDAGKQKAAELMVDLTKIVKDKGYANPVSGK